jgi:hypothetical protein
MYSYGSLQRISDRADLSQQLAQICNPSSLQVTFIPWSRRFITTASADLQSVLIPIGFYHTVKTNLDRYDLLLAKTILISQQY